MAEWHELSTTQKAHANLFADVLDNLTDWEKRELDAIRHDYEKVKAWLHKHPKIAGTGAIFGSLTAIYIGKRYKLPAQLPPPPRRF